MHRRTFMTTLAAAVASPLAATPVGWWREDDMLRIDRLVLMLDETLDLTPWRNIVIEHLTARASPEFPMYEPMLRLSGGQTVHIRNAVLHGMSRASGIAVVEGASCPKSPLEFLDTEIQLRRCVTGLVRT